MWLTYLGHNFISKISESVEDDIGVCGIVVFNVHIEKLAFGTTQPFSVLCFHLIYN